MERISLRDFLHLSEIEHYTACTEKPSSPKYTRRNALKIVAGLLGSAAALKPTVLYTPVYSAAAPAELLSELPAEQLYVLVVPTPASDIIPSNPSLSQQPEERLSPDPPVQRPDIITYAAQQADKVGLNPHRFVRAISCESSFRPRARSRDYRYHGLMQYDTRTWAEALVVYKRTTNIPDDQWMALEKDIYDPYFHIDVTIKFIEKVGYSRWPNC